MRGLSLVLPAIIGCAGAIDQCTPGTGGAPPLSGSCCQGYTYNDITLQKRMAAPVCDGTSLPPEPGTTTPTCPTDTNGVTMNPVCTAIDIIPQGSTEVTLYCGNPLANTGSGTVTGNLDVTIGQCQGSTDLCFILTATGPPVPPNSPLDANFQVTISTSALTDDTPGHLKIQATSQPVYYPFSLVFGTTTPCTSDTATPEVFIGLHTGEGGQTCWAGASTNPQTIPGGNQNWALQFTFDFECVDVCKSYCCCPPPPSIPDCPSDYNVDCPNKCAQPELGAQCTVVAAPNPLGWTSTLDYADRCCCKPPDTPTCPTGETQTNVAPGLSIGPGTCSNVPGVCNPIIGTIADCNTGDFNEACCCCTPSSQCPNSGTLTPTGCSGTPPAGQSCTSVPDGCGGNICCCSPTCTPSTQCPAPGSLTPTGCSGTPPAGQTCTSQADGCGGNICCCQPSGTCNPSTAFGVPSQCTAPGVQPGVCQTTTLSSQGCGKNRWGWYLIVDMSSGATQTYQLYTGAGLNDLSKGTDVGSVTVQKCSSSPTSGWCAFFTTTGGWVITTVHVEADCDKLSNPTKNFPCAPGNYDLNTGGTCGGSSGLPGTTWTSATFPTCEDNKYYVIFHAAVANNQAACTSTNCGNPTPS